MFIDNFAYLANYLWEKSIQNIEVVLGEQDSRLFSSNDYFYLSSIYYMNNPTLSELARKHEVSKPAVSAIIRKLIKLELVKKIQNEQDRRFYSVQLTTKGKSIILGDERQYAMIEEHLRKIIPSEEKYYEFENVVEELTHEIKEEVKNEEKSTTK